MLKNLPATADGTVDEFARAASFFLTTPFLLR
jgi:hypothetical protein